MAEWAKETDIPDGTGTNAKGAWRVEMSGFATRDAVQASRRALRAAGYAAELTPNNTLTVAGQASEAEAQRLAAQVHIWDDKHSRQSISRLAKCRSVITLWC